MNQQQNDNQVLTDHVASQKLYEFLRENGCILYEVIVGSQAYGTATPQSDIDKKFVFCLPKKHIYGTQYFKQIELNKDYVGFEIRRFLELTASNNPTILELLNSPEDCVLHKHPVFDDVLKHKNDFITKQCANSFGGYAKQQINKALGMDKMQNWEVQRVERKEPIDFCYIINGYNSYPLKDFLNKTGMDQKFCGIAKVPNARDVYALFYDWNAHYMFSDLVKPSIRKLAKSWFKFVSRINGMSLGFGYKGIYKTGEGESKPESNSLRLSSIPNGEKSILVFSYNKDGYTKHCDDYNRYQKWLKDRNTARWVETVNHGQKIDGKNMMHCKRLLQMSFEIAAGKGIVVRRPDADELLAIRRGEVPLDELVQWANEKIAGLNAVFEASDLPESVDPKFIHNLLVSIREKVYGEVELK